MVLIRHKYLAAVAALLLTMLNVAVAGEVRIAVASNFTATMQSLIPIFEKSSGHKVIASYGSSGKLYTQIINGAPFELLLSADNERPLQLEQEGVGIEGTRATYALGRLALWSIDPAMVDAQGKVLSSDRFRRLAIANPKTAPYGTAALEVLRGLGLDEALRPRLVQGDNIAQTYQFVATGNAQLGFVAYAQVKAQGKGKGSWWLVPERYHTPLQQEMILLKPGVNNRAVRELYLFLQSAQAQRLIESDGYGSEQSRPARQSGQ